MADKVVTVTYKRGAYIVVEGEKSAKTFFIIQDGSVMLTRALDIQGLDKEILGSGDFFEVESGLTGKKRLCTAIAQSDCTIIIVPENMYDALIQKRPALVQKIVLAFSRRMRELDHILAKISLKHMGSATAGPEQLYEIGKYYEHEEQLQPAVCAFYHYIKQYPNEPNVPQAEERYKSLASRLPEELLVFDDDVTQAVRKVSAGNMIFAEAMLGNAMYFIQSGSVKICKMANNNELMLAVLNKGDMFGEMALLESKPRIASAIAAEDCALLVITHQNFPVIIQRQPKLITRITTVIAERIWFVYRQIANASMRGGEERVFDGLVMFMERNGYSDEHLKSPFNINLTLQEFVEHVGMEGRVANPIIQNLIDNKIVMLRDRKIVIISPQFTINRVSYFKSSAYHNKKKR